MIKLDKFPIFKIFPIFKNRCSRYKSIHAGLALCIDLLVLKSGTSIQYYMIQSKIAISRYLGIFLVVRV